MDISTKTMFHFLECSIVRIHHLETYARTSAAQVTHRILLVPKQLLYLLYNLFQTNYQSCQESI